MGLKQNSISWKQGFFLLLLLVLVFIGGSLFYFHTHGGAYHRLFEFVVLNPNSGGYYSACAHEYGHYVYYEKLSKEQRKEWRRISNLSEGYVSDYAMTNPSEDFAESYASTIQTTAFSEILNFYDERKANFMKCEVFSFGC